MQLKTKVMKTNLYFIFVSFFCSLNSNSENKTLVKVLFIFFGIICSLKFVICKQKGNDHEVEFHEIEIQLFQEVDKSIMRSKLDLIMRSKLGLNIWQI
jgi:hypothetical protein